MHNIILFGNSGSGKSTLAKQLSQAKGLAHLDLDSLAWQATTPPQRRSIAESKQEIDSFINKHSAWVIEGCYSDLLALVELHASEIIFMNLSIEQCISNAKSRPWEPHKYESKQAQDQNLTMLIEWISQYSARDDTFSKQSHQKFYNQFRGRKRQINDNIAFSEFTLST